MAPYYFYFGFSFFLYLFHLKFRDNIKIDNLIFYALLVFIILFTGLRYQVGSDWQNYEFEYLIKNQDFLTSLANRDFGFSILNFLFRTFSLDYVILNLFLSIISVTCVFIFCKNNPNWFIGIFMCIPYFFTMCIMGYVRQGVSTGLLFLAIYALQYNKKFLFLFSVFFAISIHKSAFLYLPLFALFFINKNFFTIIFSLKKFFLFIVFILSIFIFFLIVIRLSNQWLSVIDYLKQDRSSSGALIRSLMNLIPSFIFLIFKNKLNLPHILNRICYFFTFLSILFFLLIFSKLISSTFIDRFGLSLIIFNTIIFARISLLFKDSAYKHITNFNIILYNFLIMHVLLNYSENGHFMIYKLPPIHKLF